MTTKAKLKKVIADITKNIETHLNKISQLEGPFLITENTNEKSEN